MKKIYLGFIILAGFLFTFPAYSQSKEFGYSIEHNKKKLVIPFELHSNLIIIPVTLNGKMPLRFILDTGVPHAILLEKVFSDLLNVSYDRKIDLMGGVGDIKATAYVATNVNLELPGLTAKGIQLLVMEENFLKANKLIDVDIHGIIGAEIFKRYVVKIDYDHKRLTLYKPEHFKPRRRYMEYPIEIIHSKPYLKADVSFANDTLKNGRFLIDTGASHALLMDTASHPNYQIPEKNIESVLGWTVSGPTTGQKARVDGLLMNRFHFNNVVTSFPHSGEYLEYIQDIDRQGTIGGEILNRFRVILDYGNKKLYLRKGYKYRNKFHHDMSGLVIVEAEEEPFTFTVHHVMKGSPAHQAGIKAGDFIYSINGKSTSKYTIEQACEVFKSKKGRRVKLKVKRKDEKIKFKFRLKELI